jgi:hypothetical protein
MESKGSIITTTNRFLGFEKTELIPPVAIELQFVGRAPSGEFVRLYYYPYYPLSRIADSLLSTFGISEPIIEGPGEISGIIKDC